MTRTPQLPNAQPAAAPPAHGEFAAAPSAGALDAPSLDYLVARHAPLLLEYLPVTDAFDRQLCLVYQGSGAAPLLAPVARLLVLALRLIAEDNVVGLPVVLDAIAADERIMTLKLKLAEWVRLDPDSRAVVTQAYIEHSKMLREGDDARVTFVDYLALACLKWWRSEMIPVVATPKHGLNAGSFVLSCYNYEWCELALAAYDRSISTTLFIATLKRFFGANDLHNEKERYEIVESVFGDLCDGATFSELVQALGLDA
ncbi:hypothetical protein H9P43_009241 [Blastocladiella emersonii ATCC 22665]|nr:hypothetical protein H9P43_009241 [Blastocladiella emersonii ATCC 22665]